jgi:hypothetical protein
MVTRTPRFALVAIMAVAVAALALAGCGTQTASTSAGGDAPTGPVATGKPVMYEFTSQT